MLFSSFTFIFAFLPIVWVVFHLLKRARFKAHYESAKIFLILSSLFFYAFWKVAYLPILLSSIVVNYALAKAILKRNLLVIESNTTNFNGGGGNHSLKSNKTIITNNHTNSSISSETQRVANEVKQKSGLRSHEQGNRTSRSLTKRVASLPDLLPKDEFTPKFFFTFGIIFNLCLLAFFKYTDFLLENFNAFSKLARLDFNIPLPHILLPLAISFVTFQQIAFLFDCYKRVKGELNENLHIDFIDYALFISFFPQLIAGPIVHHREMMPQFAKIGANSACGDFSRSASAHFVNGRQSPISSFASHNHENSLTILEFVDSNADSTDSSLRGKSMDSLKQSTINYEYLAKGIFIFSIGLFKKVFIADSFAKWANAGFSVVESGGFLNIAESWATSLSYTFQLYFDFSGYCDMAIGLALMFGIVLPLNFDSPYKSLNISEFWRRWHITLGRFLKECVYIPLGGNRVGKILNLRNLFIVALLSGIWHGAGWGFVIWGVLHGVAMVIHRIYGWILERNSSLGASCVDLANFECSQTISLVSHSKFAKNSTTSTANTRIYDSNKSDCAESKHSPSLAEGVRGWVKSHFIYFTQIRFYKILCWLLTFNFVNLAWVFFRAENLNGAVNLIKGMFGFANLEIPHKWSKIFSILQGGTNEIIIWIVCAVVVCLACRNSFEKLQRFRPTWLNKIFAVILVLISFCVMLFATRKIEFLYFNF